MMSCTKCLTCKDTQLHYWLFNFQEGVNYKEEEEAVAVESISLNVTDDLNSIPVVCKTEEVCTEEYEEVSAEDYFLQIG